MDISKPQSNIPDANGAPKPPQPPQPPSSSGMPSRFSVPPVSPKGPVAPPPNPYERVEKPTPISVSRPVVTPPAPSLPKKPVAPPSASSAKSGNGDHPQVLSFSSGGPSRKRSAAALIVVLGVVLVVLLLGIIVYVVLTSRNPSAEPSFMPVPSSVVTPETMPEVTAEPTSPLLDQRYTHSSGFSILPPKGWTSDTEQDLANIVFTDPNSTDAVKANVTVLSEAVTSGTTLDSYVATSKRQLAATYRNYKLVDDARVTTASGKEAHILGGTLKENNTEVRNKQLIVLSSDGKTVYVITATADPATWEAKNYNALFDQVLTSFEEPSQTAQTTATTPSPEATASVGEEVNESQIPEESVDVEDLSS